MTTTQPYSSPSGPPALESAAFIVSPTQMALDTEMLACDIWGSQAHVLMLYEAGIVPVRAARAICGALNDVAAAVSSGTFRIDPARGAQLSLEKAVIERVGPSDGSRMHTARSRNDQVMVTEMLFLRERALDISSHVSAVIDALLTLATEHTATVMPGYTHMQPAKPTSLGQWALAYADGLTRCAADLRYTWEEYDACPLGAVESYGTSWPVDRALTAQLLGFERVWEVPQDVIGSRGMVQLAYLDVCKRIALVMGKIAADLLLFTTWEYNYVHLGEEISQRLHPVTGSSVMAQKRNPDALELLRATGQEVIGIAGLAANLLSGLPMGYNRDTREMKEWVALGFGKTLEGLSTLRTVLATMTVNKERMLAAVRQNYSSTTDLADAVSQLTGVAYRQVYSIVGQVVNGMIEDGRPLYDLKAPELQQAAAAAGVTIRLTGTQISDALDPAKALARREHIGGAAPREMERMIEERQGALDANLDWLTMCNARIEGARSNTISKIDALETLSGATAFTENGGTDE